MSRQKGTPKTGGRQKGTPNKAHQEALEVAKRTGVLPLDYMLMVMRDENAEERRRDGMAIAAAPYLHQKLVAAERLGVRIGSEGADGQALPPVTVTFVVPGRED